MAHYKSNFTGKEIDAAVSLLNGTGLGDVTDGVVYRDSDGKFSAVRSENEASQGSTLSLVTTGEKYHWNKDMIPKTWLGDSSATKVATLSADGKLPLSQFSIVNSAAKESGTTWSFVTTGEKYIWNNMIPLTQRGVANGVATLDANGTVPSTQLPSYVDDILEYPSLSDFPITGETGKIYVALDTNLTYRWSGSNYVEISPSLALGETKSTAYRGDLGKDAYETAHATKNYAEALAENYVNPAYSHSVTNKGIATSGLEPGFFKIQTNSEGHLIAAIQVAKSDITNLGIIGDIQVIPASHSTSPDERVKVGTIRIDGVDTELYAVMGDQNIGVNARGNAGYVPDPDVTDQGTGVVSPNPYKYWSTDSNGTPGWHDSKREIHTTLDLEDWEQGDFYLTQTITVPGVTATNTVIISPDPTQILEYGRCAIFGSAQNANKLTFSCMQKPDEDINVNIMIFDYSVPSIPEETEGE